MLNNELYHHGIKGQKWGVRNGPPYPLESYKSDAVKSFGSRNAKKLGNEKTDNKIYTALSIAVPMAMGTVLLSSALGFSVNPVVYGLVMLANSTINSMKYFSTAKKNIDNVVMSNVDEDIVNEGKNFINSHHLNIPIEKVHMYQNEAYNYVKQHHIEGEYHEQKHT